MNNKKDKFETFLTVQAMMFCAATIMYMFLAVLI